MESVLEGISEQGGKLVGIFSDKCKRNIFGVKDYQNLFWWLYLLIFIKLIFLLYLIRKYIFLKYLVVDYLIKF